MYALWLEAGTPNEGGAREGGGLDGWGTEDVTQASYVWKNMHSRARMLLETLLASKDPIPGRDLARALGPDAREDTVFGTFGPPAKLAKEVGRKHLIRSSHSADGNTLLARARGRAAFSAARTDP
jgi:hypothetical protein